MKGQGLFLQPVLRAHRPARARWLLPRYRDQRLTAEGALEGDEQGADLDDYRDIRCADHNGVLIPRLSAR